MAASQQGLSSIGGSVMRRTRRGPSRCAKWALGALAFAATFSLPLAGVANPPQAAMASMKTATGTSQGFFDANDRLRDRVAADPTIGNVHSDVTNGHFTVYAAGAQSSRDSQAAALAPEVQPFSLAVRSAPYSGADIDAALDIALQKSKGRDFIAFTRATDASGLRAGFSPESEWGAISLDELTRQLGSPVPVTETFSLPAGATNVGKGVAFFDGRQDDEGSLDGGSYVYFGASSSSINHACTSGASAYLNGTTNRVMLTAAHCFFDSWPNVYVSSGGYRGWISSRNYSRDVGYFDGGDYSSWIYDGGYGTTSRKANGSTTRPVVGEAENVCTSGARSGSLCEVRIMEVGLTFNFRERTYTDMTLGRRFLLGGAAGNGDSGGPLIRRTYDSSEGRTVARPMGLVTGPLSYLDGNETTCNGLADVCNDYVYFSGLRDAELAMDFTVVNP